MWLKAQVPENDIPLVRMGQEIEVKVTALPGRVFKARIAAIEASIGRDHASRDRALGDPQPRRRTQVRDVRELQDRNRRSEPAPAVPAEAVIREGDLATVWVESLNEPLVFQRRKVQLGMEQDGRVQIRSGLKPGELVIARGALFVDNEWRQ